MPTTYRVGLIGCGRMGATIDDEVKSGPNAQLFLPYSHAAAIVACERMELVAVCDPIEEKAERIRDRYGAQRAYADYREMIERENLDVVSIATRPGPHAEQVIFAAEAGVKGIYCEKSLCNAVHEMDAMLQACSAARRQIQLRHAAALCRALPRCARYDRARRHWRGASGRGKLRDQRGAMGTYARGRHDALFRAGFGGGIRAGDGRGRGRRLGGGPADYRSED